MLGRKHSTCMMRHLGMMPHVTKGGKAPARENGYCPGAGEVVPGLWGTCIAQGAHAAITDSWIASTWGLPSIHGPRPDMLETSLPSGWGGLCREMATDGKLGGLHSRPEGDSPGEDIQVRIPGHCTPLIYFEYFWGSLGSWTFFLRTQ